MKLSTRQQLLKQSNIELKRLRKLAGLNESTEQKRSHKPHRLHEATGGTIYLFYANDRLGNEGDTAIPDFVVKAPNFRAAWKLIPKNHYAVNHGGFEIYTIEKSQVNKFLSAIKKEADLWDNAMQNLMGMPSLSSGKIISIGKVIRPIHVDPKDMLDLEDDIDVEDFTEPYRGED